MKKVDRILILTVASLMILGLSISYKKITHAAPPTVTAAGACAADIPPAPNCNLPFFVVQGGDVAGGSDFQGDNGATCNKQTQGMLIGAWNNDNVGGTGWYGSAVQGATINPDTAQEIASDINSDTPLSDPALGAGNAQYGHYTYQTPNPYPLTAPPPSPYYLGLANNQDNIALAPKFPNFPYPHDSAQFYGGDFLSLPCIPNSLDYNGISAGTTSLTTNPGGAMTAANVVNLALLPSGSYSFKGGLIIDDGGSSILPNKHITIAVTNGGGGGNVYIRSNITYAPYSLNTVPSLQVSVSDNNPNDYTNGGIWIQNTVSEIHGYFTSQETNNGNASIHTCALITGNNTSTISESASYNTCGANPSATPGTGPLTIYGATATDYYWLERSYGDLLRMIPGTTNAQNAAEVWRYTPELWIPDAASTSCVGPCAGTNWISATSLPPVL